MGADYIGWRSCPLQEELGVDGFLGKLKLRSYKRAVEDRVPVEKRETIQISVKVSGRPDRALRYPEICSELAAFTAGIPECADCPLSGGSPLGCYRYVTYPVDAISERLLFEFFVSGLETRDSIADQLYRDLVSQVEDEGTGWHDNRGEGSVLAELEEPLVHRWGKGKSKRRVDSAQLMTALFIALDQPALIVAYARFFSEFLAFVDSRLMQSRSADGEAVEIHVKVDGELDGKAVAKQAMDALSDLSAMASSRTIAELRDISSLLRSAIPGALTDGWEVVVDS